MKSKEVLFPPLVFNVFKPPRISSHDVVRHFKRHLPQGFGKIGHFGTLDPFASGVLMVGIGGAARLNDYIHAHLPKTYLAVGKLGIETPTGDYTSEISQLDESSYLTTEIAKLPREFLHERMKEKFEGDYLQSPHQYSAAKYMGKNLHEWARLGVEIKKDEVQRKIYSIEVIKYSFPYFVFRATVSSGTYIRTLFSDMARDLGTFGSLIALHRESVGSVRQKEALRKINWPKERSLEIMGRGMSPTTILPFEKIILSSNQVKEIKNGAFIKLNQFNLSTSHNEFWMLDESQSLVALAEKIEGDKLKARINFHELNSL